MSIVKTHNFQAGDRKRYQLGYTRWLDTSESEKLSLIDITVTPTNSDESPSVLNVQKVRFLEDETVLEYIVDGGTAGVRYDVEFTMTSTLNQLTTNTVRFRVI